MYWLAAEGTAGAGQMDYGIKFPEFYSMERSDNTKCVAQAGGGTKGTGIGNSVRGGLFWEGSNKVIII